MKRTLFLATILASCLGNLNAATYTNLTESWCDETNNVIYNGQGYFAVESAANTSVDITIDLESLVSYVNSNDYKTGNYLLLWDCDVADYGLADNADTSKDNGSRVPYLSGYWDGASWNSTTNNIPYTDLSTYAVNGYVTLNITNSTTNGVKITTSNSEGTSETLYEAGGLKTGSNTKTYGYYVNLNYVTSVTLNTTSTLDTDSYVPPADYSKPFESQRTDGTSIGRVTFLGDSITHGVNDQSYRWQFFKILTDNGIENEIVGPREGYYNTPGHTEDAGTSYGGAEFANVHLAQASGRTHNIISGSTSHTFNGTSYSSGVNYGAHSTSSTAKKFDSNTWFCMMGTNDLLSDTPNSGPTTDQYAEQMQKVLGGKVTYDSANDKYNWTAGENWGTMSAIVNDVYTDGDTFYMLSITPWGSHSNHNRDMDHYAGAEFNRNLEEWTKAYSSQTGKKVVYVDVTRGMIDQTSTNRSMGHDAFFNNSGDRLHPNDQGSIIMAGNLARAMGIGGRTAGLERQGTSSWNGASIGTVTADTTQLVAENAFTMTDGYTIDFAAHFGNGAADGWLAADKALSISLGDGTNSGTLNLSEGYIMWGSDILFCWDNSTLADEGNLRVAWHNGNTADNVLSGYYVWLGDMLIGQGLDATTGEGLNGILVSAKGADGTITGLTWADKAYAPTTQGMSSAENAYYTTQNPAMVNGLVTNTAYTTSGKDFSAATEVTLTSSTHIFTSAPEDNTDRTVVLNEANGWTGMTSAANSGELNVQLTGKVTNTIFGAMSNATEAVLTLELAEGAEIGGGTYDGKTAAIAGSYGGGDAESFHVYLNGATIGGDVVGGSINNNGVIGDVRLVLNGGSINGNIIGGSKVDAGVVNKASIIVTGGTITGNINAGGDAGTIGNTSVTITGGTIKGNIIKGTAAEKNEAVVSVTVEGNSASIGGNITADKVTLRGVTASDSEAGFDKYAGLITTGSLTLDNVQVDLKAELSKDISTIEVENRSNTSAVMGERFSLDKLFLSNDTTFSAYKADTAANSAMSEYESSLFITLLEVGKGATLNANLVFNNNSVLILNDSLTMGSDVALFSGMSLTLSDAMLNELYGMNEVALFTGVDKLTLDGQELADGIRISANSIFSNLDPEWDFNLSFSGGTVSIYAIPEPATATLSLLALAGLAMRRRRRV